VAVGFRRANAARCRGLGRGRLLAELKSRYGGDDSDGHDVLAWASKCAWSGSASGNRDPERPAFGVRSSVRTELKVGTKRFH